MEVYQKEVFDEGMWANCVVFLQGVVIFNEKALFEPKGDAHRKPTHKNVAYKNLMSNMLACSISWPSGALRVHGDVVCGQNSAGNPDS